MTTDCTWRHGLLPKDAQRALMAAFETHDTTQIEAVIAAVKLVFPHCFAPED